ncbi:MAG: HTTM domain-containing protein [Actinobacteria bacterium]|nr:HTTM domain-containing protein [Actinomycetota bacterium]
MRYLERMQAFLHGQATALPIGAARIGVGIAAMLAAVELSSVLADLDDPAVVRVPRFEWIADIPPEAVVPFLVLWMLAGLAFCLGWNTRPAGALLIGLLGYVLVLDQQLYANHLYLLTLMILLLTLGHSDASLSIRARRHGGRETIPAWPVVLIRTQVSIVYAFAAISKLNLPYIAGAVLLLNSPVAGIESLPHWIFIAAAVASVAVEAFLTVAFWIRRFRTGAVVVGVGFHLIILASVRVVPDLITFAVLMASAYLAFFSKISPTGSGTQPREAV